MYKHFQFTYSHLQYYTYNTARSLLSVSLAPLESLRSDGQETTASISSTNSSSMPTSSKKATIGS